MIVIIGGGISGLAAAHELARRGLEFRVLEASERTGGLIRTEEADGFTIDCGPDSMLASKPSALELCEAVGLGPRLQDMKEPRSAFVLARGHLFPLPQPSTLGLPTTIRAAAGFRLLPFPARLRVLAEPVIPRRNPPDESIASFFTRRFGSAAASLVAQPLLGGIHAGDTRQLSIRSLFPNLVRAEQSGSVLRTLNRARPAGGRLFASLAGGMETLPKAIAGSLPREAVRCGSSVRSIARASDRWRVESSDGLEHADAVVLATPLPVTASLLGGVDAAAAALCRQVPHASTVIIVFAWPRGAIAHPLRGSGFVVAPPSATRSDARPSASVHPVRITAATWISSKWEGRAPPRYALLRAFIGGMHDADAIGLADEDLYAIARRDLSRILGISGPPILSRLYRWRDASPQLNVGHAERVSRVDARLATYPGLFVAGRGYRAVGIPDCIDAAQRAAAAAADYVRSHGHAPLDRHAHSERP